MAAVAQFPLTNSIFLQQPCSYSWLKIWSGFFHVLSFEGLCRCGLLSNCDIFARNGNIPVAADCTHIIQFIEWDPATPELINLSGWVSVWANPDLLLLLVPLQGLYFLYLLLEVIV